MDWMNSSQFVWGYMLTVGPIAFCIGLYCWAGTRKPTSRR